MTDLLISGVTKSYAAAPVLRGVDLAIAAGEFFTLLGPSGCGKTTLLRIIAGFLGQDRGEISVGGESIDAVPAHRRDIGMVFQDYAIFPHLCVADNVAFGLKARKLPRDEIARRVEESLGMVRLGGFGGRYPAEMSGGQQQRVGLARAMAIRPRLLLMDEPLSNLDAKLRIELRDEIRDLQKRLGITTIYVTHDQEEALAISDRICVMNAGVAEQVATPYDIYRDPRRRFAASFIGAMNFLPAEIAQGEVRVAGRAIGLRTDAPDGPAELAIRPENVRLERGADALVVEGDLRKSTFLGREAHCTLATPLGDIVAQVSDPPPDLAAAAGRRVPVALPLDRLFVFDRDGARLPLRASGSPA